MYKLTQWASKIKGFDNSYSRLLWLINKERSKDKSKYVTVPFIQAARQALEQEYKNTLAFLDNEIEKRK